MSERDELAKVLFIADERIQTEEYAAKVVDAILAAGYRKPRVINTWEELDALPLNTIILDAEELPLYKDDSMRVPEWCFGDNAVAVRLPAKVIYDPGAAG